MLSLNFLVENITQVVSLIEEPFEIPKNIFSVNTCMNANLYVPVGTIDKYKATQGWNNFDHIVEGTPSGIETLPIGQPMNTIKYLEDGKLVIKKGKKKYNVGAMEIQ